MHHKVIPVWQNWMLRNRTPDKFGVKYGIINSYQIHIVYI